MRKLSVLMRKGYSRVGEKSIYAMFRFHLDKQLYAACAIGCVYLGTNPHLADIDLYYSGNRVNEIDTIKNVIGHLPVVQNPSSGEAEDIARVIADLNDSKKWSIEEIADWLESIGY